MQQRKTPAFFVFSCNLLGLNHSPETRFSSATLAKTAPLWGPIRDKYSQSLWVMKTAGLTTLGYEMSVSLGILFFRCSASLKGPKLRTLPAGNAPREWQGAERLRNQRLVEEILNSLLAQIGRAKRLGRRPSPPKRKNVRSSRCVDSKAHRPTRA